MIGANARSGRLSPGSQPRESLLDLSGRAVQLDEESAPRGEFAHLGGAALLDVPARIGHLPAQAVAAPQMVQPERVRGLAGPGLVMRQAAQQTRKAGACRLAGGDVAEADLAQQFGPVILHL